MAEAHAFLIQPELILCELDGRSDALESYSPFCLKVRRALRLLDLRFESRPEAMPSAFRDLNPKGKVPVVLFDREPVSDSTRILERLDRLRPGVLYDHPEAALWEELADRSLNAYMVAARWADPTQWPRTRDRFFGDLPWPLRVFLPERLRASVLRSLRERDVYHGDIDEVDDELVTLLDDLDDRAPERGFWLGEQPTAADIALFAQLQSMRSDLTPKQRGWIERRRTLAAYLDRVDQVTAPA